MKGDLLRRFCFIPRLWLNSDSTGIEPADNCSLHTIKPEQDKVHSTIMRLLTSLLLCASMLMTGCSWLGIGTGEDADKPDTQGYTEKDFFDVIQKDLSARRWTDAIQNLEALEAQFPFGEYAEQAQLELIFAHHKLSEHEAAIAAADRFIRLHPQHPNVDYAYYLKGLSHYAQDKGFFSQLLPTDDTKRDPGSARSSFAAFSELLAKYPESPYAPDARKRMIHLRNWLARQEIHAANYYFVRGSYLAAANRGRYVVENFQMTPAVPDGLAVMAQAYYLLGLQDLSEQAAQTLASNYPEHPALDKNGNFKYRSDVSGEDRSWLNKATFGFYDNTEPPGYDSRHIYNSASQQLAEKEKGEDTNPNKKSWWHWLTFGIFD